MHADPLPPFFFAYSSWTTAQHHMAEAALLGSILGASFLLTAFLTAMGLTFGGRWREMPAGLSWAVVQKLEMVSVIALSQIPMGMGLSFLFPLNRPRVASTTEHVYSVRRRRCGV